MALSYGILILSVPDTADMAAKLAESIRRYRLPRGVKLPVGAPDYRSIALDCLEAPMDDAVRLRLDQSAALVLLCSPGAKNSRPILDRLEYYKAAWPERDITAVLADGEPVDSFPAIFVEKREVEYILPDMSVIKRVETIEPIAADLRADTPRRWREVLRYETVRIIASVLGLHPDELEQRHRARKKRAAAAVLAVVGAVSLSAAAVFLRLGVIAKNEGDIAAEQTRLSVSIARRTMEELPASLAVYSIPEGARVYLDNNYKGVAPALFESLPLGEHRIRVEKDGFDAYPFSKADLEIIRAIRGLEGGWPKYAEEFGAE